MSSLLLGLVPALGWGMQAIVMQIVGGKFTNKVMGMVTGNLIFAAIIFIFRQPASLTPSLIIGAVLCSVFWGIGQILQVCSFDLLGVSMAMPINTAEQLIGTILFGVLFSRMAYNKAVPIWNCGNFTYHSWRYCHLYSWKRLRISLSTRLLKWNCGSICFFSWTSWLCGYTSNIRTEWLGHAVATSDSDVACDIRNCISSAG